MKGYTVFNAEQIDGLPGHFYATVAPAELPLWPADATEPPKTVPARRGPPVQPETLTICGGSVLISRIWIK
jgi:hypothetical protein